MSLADVHTRCVGQQLYTVVANINPAFKIILNKIRTPLAPFSPEIVNIQPRKATPPSKSYGVGGVDYESGPRLGEII